MRSTTPLHAVLFSAALLLFCPLRPVTAGFQERTGGAVAVTRCDLAAYVIDHDPNGLNVRSGPGNTSKIIGNLPVAKVEGVGVHITGSSGEWIRIDRAVEQGGETDRVFFSGDGWVYGPLLGTDGVGWVSGGTPLYQNPTTKSRILARMLAGGDGAVVRGCQGKWMLVDHKHIKGWAEGKTLCDNSLTTCS